MSTWCVHVQVWVVGAGAWRVHVQVHGRWSASHTTPPHVRCTCSEPPRGRLPSRRAAPSRGPSPLPGCGREGLGSRGWAVADLGRRLALAHDDDPRVVGRPVDVGNHAWLGLGFRVRVRVRARVRARVRVDDHAAQHRVVALDDLLGGVARLWGGAGEVSGGCSGWMLACVAALGPWSMRTQTMSLPDLSPVAM